MRVGCIANTVYTLHDGVHGGIISDGRIGAIQVVVDGSRQSNHWHIILYSELPGTSQRTITANNYQCVDLFLHAGLVGLLHTLRSHKLLRAGCLQDRTSASHDTAHVLGGKVLHLVVNQSFVTTIYTFNIKTIIDTGTRHGTYGGIHSWCIASRRQDTNRLNLSHITYFLSIVVSYIKFTSSHSASSPISAPAITLGVRFFTYQPSLMCSIFISASPLTEPTLSKQPPTAVQ